jgi:hypothetical protein
VQPVLVWNWLAVKGQPEIVRVRASWSEILRLRRHRVTILKASEAVNSFGEVLITWQPIAKTWAGLSLSLQHGPIATIKYQPVTVGMCIEVEGNKFEITHIRDYLKGSTRLLELRLREFKAGHRRFCPMRNEGEELRQGLPSERF